MAKSYDVIVIGAGQAGPSLAVRFAEAGYRVALIERWELGGTCVNDGCMPTKTLVASARVAHLARTAGLFGVAAGEVRVDMAAVKARKDALVEASRASLTRWIEGTKNLDLIYGEARFVGRGELAVGDQRLRSGRIFINTGGRPLVPAWPGLAQIPYLTNETVMDLEELPQHLVVAGGSYIGLEFAQMFRRFGSQVTVLETAERLVPREDRDISAAIETLLHADGIDIHTGVRDVEVGAGAVGVRLTVGLEHGMLLTSGSHLLIATGRRPNVEALNLAAAGVALDPRGYIAVDDRLQTSEPGVWALGDVHGLGGFTHTSFNDYEVVAANVLDGEDRRITERIPAYALFTDPPLARIGMSEDQARRCGRPVLKGFLPMARVGRARERGETYGFMKVLVDAQARTILGAALLGIEADEAIHMLLVAMAAGMTVEALRRVVAIHPTVSELIPTLLSDLRPLEPAANAERMTSIP